MSADNNCIFCKIATGEIPSIRIYEDDRAIAFMDINPLGRGHLLVIPREHLGNIVETDPDLYGHLCSVVCKLSKALNEVVAPDGMNVLQLNGRAANQVVPHLHIHLVPRWEGDGLTISEWEPVQGDLDEIQATADAIKSRL